MSGWTYKTELVTVGANSQHVRQLTVSERKAFGAIGARIKAGELTPADLPGMVMGFGCIDPPRTDDEIASMPSDLADACVAKILALTGMKVEAESDEKKEPPSSTPSS